MPGDSSKPLHWSIPVVLAAALAACVTIGWASLNRLSDHGERITRVEASESAHYQAIDDRLKRMEDKLDSLARKP